MRMTNQMLNRSTRRTGLMYQGGILSRMNQINQSNGGAQNRIMSALKTKSGGSSGRSKYKNQESAADDLCRQVKKFAEKGSRSLFGKCEKTGDTAELCKEAERFTEQYNSLLSSLNNNPDSLDAFYKQSLRDLVTANKDALADIGIVPLKDGKLHIEKDKVKSASAAKLKEVFGEESDLMEKIRFVAAKVSERASVNLVSMSGSYSRGGNMNYYTPNKYDFRG